MSVTYRTGGDLLAMYTVGIDGGGTKTELVVVDDHGRVVAQARGGGMNGCFIPQQQVFDNLSHILAEIGNTFHSSDEVTCVYTVMIGQEFTPLLVERFRNARVSSVGEYRCALAAGGSMEPTGVAIIAGTGSGVFGWNGEENHIGIGGWGMTLGDEGGATDIAVQAFKAAVRAQDGRGPQTELLPELMRFFNIKSLWAMPTALSHQTILRHEFAGFSAVVARLADAGDSVAQRIMREAGESLAADALYVAGRLFQEEQPFPVVLSGGVFNSGHWVMEPIIQAFAKNYPLANVHRVVMSPAQAAALMALRDGQHV